MMQRLEFVHVTYTGTVCNDAPSTTTTNRHLVRSQVMKDFRRKERQERMARCKKLVNGTVDGSKLGPKMKEMAQKQTYPGSSSSLRLPLDVSTSKVWRRSFAERLTEEWYPPEYHVAVLYNISYTYDALKSAPVVTIQDTLSMLNAGSIDGIDRLLLEARIRYVATINLLRQKASGKASDMPVATLGYLAMACLMCEVNIDFFIINKCLRIECCLHSPTHENSCREMCRSAC